MIFFLLLLLLLLFLLSCYTNVNYKILTLLYSIILIRNVILLDILTINLCKYSQQPAATYINKQNKGEKREKILAESFILLVKVKFENLTKLSKETNERI